MIFSRNSTSWGSFSYDPKEDTLRVKTSRPRIRITSGSPTSSPSASRPGAVALEWEELAIPLTITVENAPQLWVEGMRRELRGMKGFTSFNFRTAAEYCLGAKVNLAEALVWAQKAVTAPFIGEENFHSLMTLSRAQAANGARPTRKDHDRAVDHATANPLEIHMIGRQLLTDGKKEEALQIFEANAKHFPNQWPVHVGLMRGYSAMGNLKEALDEAKLALPQAPDEPNRAWLQEGDSDRWRRAKASTNLRVRLSRSACGATPRRRSLRSLDPRLSAAVSTQVNSGIKSPDSRRLRPETCPPSEAFPGTGDAQSAPQMREHIRVMLAGPGHLRFFIQPAIAILLGVLDGRRHERLGGPRYGIKVIIVPLVVALTASVVFQRLVRTRIGLGYVVLYAAIFVAIPYFVAQSLTFWLARRWRRRRRPPGSGVRAPQGM